MCFTCFVKACVRVEESILSRKLVFDDGHDDAREERAMNREGRWRGCSRVYVDILVSADSDDGRTMRRLSR